MILKYAKDQLFIICPTSLCWLIFIFFKRKMKKLQILLTLVIGCLLMLLIQALMSSNRSSVFGFSNSAQDQWMAPGENQNPTEGKEENDYEDRTTPKLPFSLDRFGDYEPIFLAQKVIPLKKSSITKEQLDHFKHFSSNLLTKHGGLAHSPELFQRLDHGDQVINKRAKTSVRSKVVSINSADSLRKQLVREVRVPNSKNSFNNSDSSFPPFSNVADFDFKPIWQLIQEMNAIDPLRTLTPLNLQDSQISRIYLLTYFRSGSSFLGELLQQVFRAFYLFEPLHFQTDGTRLSFSDSRLNTSTRLVLDMVDHCDFSQASKYLQWINIDRNRFLLKWNRMLWSVCHRKPTMCSDANFVRQVCKRAAHRIVKLTRLPLFTLLEALENDMIKSDLESHLISKNLKQINPELNKTHYNFELVETKGTLTQMNEVWNSNIDRKNSLKLPNQPDLNSTTMKRPDHVLYLVRDPRAVYASRKRLSWCSNSSCSSIESLCGEMQKDLNAFEQFHLKMRFSKLNNLDEQHSKFSIKIHGQTFKKNDDVFLPNSSKSEHNQPKEKTFTKKISQNVMNFKQIQLRLIRFEDFALRPLQETKRLYSVLGLPFTNTIERYVRSHTGEGLSWSDMTSTTSSLTTSSTSSSFSPFMPGSRNGLAARLAKIQLTREQRNPHSTKRESPLVPFAWRHQLSWSEVQQLQNNCSNVMQQLGYRVVSRMEYDQLNDRNAASNLLTSIQLIVS